MSIREILEKYAEEFEVTDGKVTMGYNGTLIKDRNFDKIEKELLDSLKNALADKIEKETYTESRSEDNLVEHIVNEIRKFKEKK